MIDPDVETPWEELHLGDLIESLAELRRPLGVPKQVDVSFIFELAAKHFTNRQFEIFVLYHGMCSKETDIARALGVSQPYVSIVLKSCYIKLRKLLRIYGKKRSDFEEEFSEKSRESIIEEGNSEEVAKNDAEMAKK